MRVTRCVRIGVGALAVLGIASGCGVAVARADARSRSGAGAGAAATGGAAGQCARRSCAAPSDPAGVAARHDAATRALRAPVRCARGATSPSARTWTRRGCASRRRGCGRDSTRATNQPRSCARSGRSSPTRSVVLVNVESAIGRGSDAVEVRTALDELLRVSRAGLQCAARCGRGAGHSVVGNVANNHARDAGSEGRDSTIAALARAGVVVTGADTIATAGADAGGRHDRRARILHVGFDAGRARYRCGAPSRGARRRSGIRRSS